MIVLFLVGAGWIVQHHFMPSAFIPRMEVQERYLSLSSKEKSRLPIAPHALKFHARPSQQMIQLSQGKHLKFRVLDKRTLNVHTIKVRVGERIKTPWQGFLSPQAFVPDLMIRQKEARHGDEGHVNPAVWVKLEDEQERLLHEGWFFSRDTAQTTWDHFRFDITFLGIAMDAKKG
ncbi:hypothetical protein ACQZV8_14370 [Magnetococcales bacterium HHB-1]